MYCDTVRCKKCRWPVNRRVHVDPDGVPRWTCPICGAVWDGSDFYKTVSRKEAAEIIEFRYPEGYFMVKEDGKFVGIDNSDGDAFTEAFKSKERCIRWLAGEEFYDDEDEDEVNGAVSDVRAG